MTPPSISGLVDRLRAARPDLALSSDFIVGHPGESEADFAATLDLVERVGFASAFSFKYSPRPGTPAASAPDQIAEADKDRRLQDLQAVLRRQQAAFNAACAGRVLPVLFTGFGRRPGQIGGRTPYLQPVHVDGPATLIGIQRDGDDCSRSSRFAFWQAAARHTDPACPAIRTTGASLRLTHVSPSAAAALVPSDPRATERPRRSAQGGDLAVRRQCAALGAARRP